MIRVATDVGGTFTDLVHFDPEAAPGSSIVCAKVDSTPPGFEHGVMNALAKTQIRGEDMDFFVHGSTIIINTLTERKGVKTALITTRGFRDVLEIARGNRPDLFNFRYRKPEPLVPRYLRKEVTERIDYKGNILTPLKTGELRPLVDELREEGVDAIAVCFLHAYRNPDHELAAVREIQRLWPEVAVVASHVLSREWREYERTNTTAAAASVQPVAYGYLSGLEASLADRGFSKSAYVMLSNDGIDTFAAVRNKGITMVESGPAAGVFGAATLGRLTGTQNLITLDIGGTTAKCSLIENGRVRLTNKYVLERTPRYAGYPLLVPVVDIVEIGNGGGSIAWLDDAGKLRGGPRSAGAAPGPAAYGRGGKDFTTTDAHLLTGRIDPGHFLGGEIKVDLDAMNGATERLCKVMKVSREELAGGVLRIANNNMVNALKLVSLNRGYDPRNFSLVVFGGGGGLHGTDLARTQQIPEVIVPVNASVFSCWGMLQTDLRRDHIVSVPLVLAVTNANEVDTTFWKLDMWAGVASLRLGANRLEQLVMTYGLEVFTEALRRYMDYGEVVSRQALARLPKGTFRTVGDLESLGQVKMLLTITDDHFTIDLRGNRSQVNEPANCPYAVTLCGAKVAFKAITDPGGICNAGVFRPLRLLCDEGSLFAAKRPAPVGLFHEPVMFVTDLVWRSLAEVLPEQLTAGHFGSVGALVIGSIHPDTGKPAFLIEPEVGGFGAGMGYDGANAQFSKIDGETFNTPVELNEARNAVFVRQYRFNEEDGGEGEYRGGKGVVLEYEIKGEDAWTTGLFTPNHTTTPWSINGGKTGSSNRVEILRRDGRREILGKFSNVPLKQGDIIRVITGAGGGAGDPLQRDRTALENDIRNGYITERQAQQYYGHTAGQ